jgi:2-amino-4-hydroxy-6-hydroxymethyldihydropteridine diphosphokinase
MTGTIERCAAGLLPAWACVSPGRHAHIERVATLLTSWAETLAPERTALWRAAAWLHDSLRDADAAVLREALDPEFKDWPAALLHGPAAATRVRREQPDAPSSLLDAVAYHTVGNARLDMLGRALYLADYLEPGRPVSPVARASLRARMPAGFDSVLEDVARARITHLMHTGSALRPETVDFWNAIVTG